MAKPTKPTKSVKPDIASDVMNRIKTEDIHMHSKLYFVAWTVALLTSTILTVFFASVLLTILLNDFDSARDANLLRFGDRGRDFIIKRASWMLMVFLMVAVGSAYLLTKRFDFASKRKSFSVLGIVVSAILMVSVFLVFTGINDRIAEGPLRPFRSISESLEKKKISGIVQEISRKSLLVKEDQESKVIDVIVPNQEMYDRLYDFFVKDDEITLFGDYNDEGDFELIGIFPPKSKLNQSH